MPEPRTELDAAICTLLDFVDLAPPEIAKFFGYEVERITRAIPGLIESGHLTHSPTEVFAFRNTGHWNPDAASTDDEPAGPGSPKRRHADYLDKTSPFFGDPDEQQIIDGAPVTRT